MIDMSLLRQLGDLRKMQREISRQAVTVEESGVKVTITGEQKIKELEFSENPDPKIVAKVINQAFDQLKRKLAKNLISGSAT